MQACQPSCAYEITVPNYRTEETVNSVRLSL